MPRTIPPPPKRKADAVLTADWHLRHDTPRCRDDDFTGTQFEKVSFIADLAFEHECPVLIAGDIFHRWNPPIHLVTKAILKMPEECAVVPGNHDLPNHREDQLGKSALGLLLASEVVSIIDTVPSRIPRGLSAFSIGEWREDFIVMHSMVYKGKEPFPGCSGRTAEATLRSMPWARTILCGDNHRQFVERTDDGRVLVNPGSMCRMTNDQRDHRPAAYLWWDEGNRVERVELPFDPDPFVDERDLRPAGGAIDEDRARRMRAFVERAREDVELELSFERNMRSYLKRNRTRKRVKELLTEVMG